MTLTKRQRDVVRRLIRGERVPAIAHALRCSESTVRAHIAAVAGRYHDPHPPMQRVILHADELLADSA